MKDKLIIFNPKSANAKHRIPNSILQVGASIHGNREYILVDGNLEQKPLDKIIHLIKSGDYKYFCSSVMPGPQLRQAIPFTKKIKEKFPNIITIWGGYFPSNQPKVCLDSGFVDYIVNGPGDTTFPSLIDFIENNKVGEINEIKNLIYKNEKGELIKTKKEDLLDQDTLPNLPYNYLDS